jgi:hypothetical protein
MVGLKSVRLWAFFDAPAFCARILCTCFDDDELNALVEPAAGVACDGVRGV